MRRFTVVIQTVEVDANGETIEAFSVLGPTLATTSIEHAEDAAARLEELAPEILRGYAEPSTISNLYPNSQ